MRMQILLLLLLFIKQILSYQCSHHYKNTEIQVQNNLKKEINHKVFINSLLYPIRITADFTRLQKVFQENEMVLIQKAYQQSVKFFSQLLKTNSIQGNNVFPNYLSCDNILIEEKDKIKGIEDSDLHIYFEEGDKTYSSACVLSAQTGRPIFGYFSINKDDFHFESEQKFRLINTVQIFKHHLMHILGFSHQLFPYFIDENGKNYPKSFYSSKVKLGDKLANFLYFPNLKKLGKEYFECDSIEGIPIEIQDNQLGSHWDKIVNKDDLMLSQIQDQKQIFSQFDAALLKDTGWYTVNDILVTKTEQGKGEGCQFFFYQCLNQNMYFDKSQNTCKKCHLNCKTCFDQSASNCISCSQNYKFQNNKCYKQCPKNMQWNYSSMKCEEVENLKGIYCNNCVSGQFCHKGQCYDDCDKGYFAQIINDNLVCEKCQKDCKVCISENKCLQCKGNLKIQRGSCVEKCGSNYYLNKQNYCNRCNLSCSSCMGPKYNDCLSCPDKFKLINGECRVESKVFSYQSYNPENEQSELLKHPENYKKHSGGHHGGGGHHSEGHSSGGHEGEHSSGGHEGEHSSGGHEGEHSGNSGENGHSDDNNSQGKKGENQDDQSKIPRNKQEGTCEKGYFAQEMKGQILCAKCQLGCLVCKSYLRCDLCSNNLKSQNGSCVQQCNSNYYVFQSNKCKICHSSCSSCSGPNSTDCLQCNREYQLKNGECIEKPKSQIRLRQNDIQENYSKYKKQIIHKRSHRRRSGGNSDEEDRQISKIKTSFLSKLIFEAELYLVIILFLL